MCEGRTAVVVYLLLALIGVGVGCVPEELPPPENPISVARQMYTLGEQAYAAGDWQSALEYFEHANAAKFHHSTLKAIAECKVQLGDLEGGIEALEQYLEIPEARNKEAVGHRLEELHGYANGERPSREDVMERIKKLAAAHPPSETPTEVRCDSAFLSFWGTCWSRCPLGQQWSIGGCEGDRRLGITLHEAAEGCAELGPGCDAPNQIELTRMLGQRRPPYHTHERAFVHPCAESESCSRLYEERLDGMALWAAHSHGVSPLGDWFYGPDGVVTRRSGDQPGDDPVGAVCICRGTAPADTPERAWPAEDGSTE